MIIRIELATREPPTGRLTVEAHEVAFEGWLGILQALQDLIDAPTTATTEEEER